MAAVSARITWGPRSARKRTRDTIKLGSYINKATSIN